MTFFFFFFCLDFRYSFINKETINFFFFFLTLLQVLQLACKNPRKTFFLENNVNSFLFYFIHIFPSNFDFYFKYITCLHVLFWWDVPTLLPWRNAELLLGGETQNCLQKWCDFFLLLRTKEFHSCDMKMNFAWPNN